MLQESYKVRRALLVAAFVLLAAMLLLPAAGGSAARSRAQDYTARIPSSGTAPPADPSAAGWTSAASGPASCFYYYTFNSSDVPKTICDLCIITSTLPLAYTEGLEHVYLTLNHADLGQLEVSLTAPNNTTVVLMDNVCAGTPPAGRIDLGRAGPPIGATCPPAAPSPCGLSAWRAAASSAATPAAERANRVSPRRTARTSARTTTPRGAR
jgi:hypothetical protein